LPAERIKFENSPGYDYPQVAQNLGVSRQYAHKEGTKRGWQKSLKAAAVPAKALAMVLDGMGEKPAQSSDRAAFVDRLKRFRMRPTLAHSPHKPLLMLA
jgi:hypothetical protein